MKKALEPLLLSWGVPALRQRLLFMLGAAVLYVMALNVPLPNVDHVNLGRLFENAGGVLDFIDIFGGGALRKLSVLALGIMPYITASIVFQVLNVAFPALKELQKEGEYGRRKVAQWTRWAAIVLTLVQAIVATRAFQSEAFAVLPEGFGTFLQSVLSLTAGTMFLIWLSEQITTRGVGNGMSFIIFAGIVAQLPGTVRDLAGLGAYFQLLLMAVIFVATVYIVITITQGERRIPIRYAARQAGRRVVQGGERTHLPLKMAAAGVIPIIFAISLVLFPGQIAQFYMLSRGEETGGFLFAMAEGVSMLFSPQSLFASLCYAGLVMLFTYFYTAVLFDVRDIADNLKRYGGQVQGYAPGRPTELHINRVLTRITFAGGLFLATIALMQWWMPTILQLPAVGGASLLIGGTSLLIVVGVALDIMQNLDQQLKMRQYDGLARRMERGRL